MSPSKKKRITVEEDELRGEAMMSLSKTKRKAVEENELRGEAIMSPSKKKRKTVEKDDLGGEAMMSLSKTKRKTVEENELRGEAIMSPSKKSKTVEENEFRGEAVMSPSKKRKRVTFQEPVKDEPDDENVTYIPLEKDMEVDVPSISGVRTWKTDKVMPDLRYGKFTKEDDEKIKDAVFKYIKMRGWDEKGGLQTIIQTSREEARGCWIEIAKCLPIRPVKQIYVRASRLLGGFKRGKWSAEELEELTRLQKLHGHKWTKICELMNRHPDVCKDKWRHLKLVPTRRTGTWDQAEYDKLCKLVRRSLRVKESIPSKALDRRQVRDDINWEWIAEVMQRDCCRCADVWYRVLASPMISAGKWANGDDRLLLQRLIELGAASEEALDWDTILDHRDGEVCMIRWKEMTRLLGKSDHVSFEDKLELLANRYAPDLLGIEDEV